MLQDILYADVGTKEEVSFFTKNKENCSCFSFSGGNSKRKQEPL